MTRNDSPPRPIMDRVDSILLEYEGRFLLTVSGSILLILFLLTVKFSGPEWFAAMTGTSGLMTFSLGIGLHVWRWFKRWMYPTHYREGSA